MSFISLSFIGFLILTGIVYYLLPDKVQWCWLLLISLFFYACYDIRMMLFLLFSVATTFYGAKRLVPEKEAAAYHGGRKLVLAAILFINIGLLLFLKYYGFAGGLATLFFQRIGQPFALPNLRLLVPVGISFYTLQAVGYCIDIYRGKAEPEKSLAKYALFVSFFPQILQGPIGRFDQLAPQLFSGRRFRYETVAFGTQLMLWGCFKKMVIADRASIFVNAVYMDVANYAGFQVFVASLLYTLQIYTDFSGCVDIVRGAAQIFGIELAENFHHPYFACSIPDFWRRWHMSFSSWLRDYLYIPLGGNRKGKARKYINVVLVFLASGVWHGVGIHYIVWGLLHGVYQVIGGITETLRKKLLRFGGAEPASLGHRFFQWLLTFSLVNFAWIFFRAPSLRDALKILGRMAAQWNPWVLFDGSLYGLGLDQRDFHLLLVCTAVLIIVSLIQEKIRLREAVARQPLVFRWCVYFAGIFAVILFGIYGPGYDASQFIYGQF